jgi:hypothetical protein
VRVLEHNRRALADMFASALDRCRAGSKRSRARGPLGSISAAAVLPHGDYLCEHFRSGDAAYKQLFIEKIKSLYDADLDDEASHDCPSGPRRLQAQRRVGEPDQSVQPAGHSHQLPRGIAPVAAARDPHRATRDRFGEMGRTCVAMERADELEMMLAFVSAAECSAMGSSAAF